MPNVEGQNQASTSGDATHQGPGCSTLSKPSAALTNSIFRSFNTQQCFRIEDIHLQASIQMAPGVLLDDDKQEHVTFHAHKGKLSRPVLKGDARVETFDTIPQIDVERMWSASLEDRKAVAKEVGDAFRDAGFMYAINHGISEELQNRMFGVMKEFFDLPVEQKMKIHVNNSPAIKGYEALLETRLDDSTRGTFNSVQCLQEICLF
jgi:hypothetical protein